MSHGRDRESNRATENCQTADSKTGTNRHCPTRETESDRDIDTFSQGRDRESNRDTEELSHSRESDRDIEA